MDKKIDFFMITVMIMIIISFDETVKETSPVWGCLLFILKESV